MNEAPDTNASGGVSKTGTPAALPAFDPARLPHEITRDRWLRIGLGVLVAVAVLFFAGWMPGRAGVTASWGLLVSGLLVLGAWVVLSVGNAKVAGAARGLLALVEREPDAVERALSALLKKRGLVGWVRVMVYHTWAALRHRQGRHAEAAALCRGVLHEDLGPGEGARPALLLMLAESSLELRDWPTAYGALHGLHTVPLSLGQVLQRLGLQCRYEVGIGADEAALRRWHDKTELAELMPAGLCGATHAMLAVAAYRLERFETAAWLDARARLLCDAAQLDELREQGLAMPA